MNNNSIPKIDFVGIGVQRCATSWIYECLREHPQLCMPASKGNGYFKRENFEKGIYDPCFDCCGEEGVAGEFTLSYYLELGAAERIKSHNPDMKILISLRNPVDRAFSNYLSVNSLQAKGWGNLREAAEKEPMIMERGLYYKYLKRYFELFPRDNILVLLVDDIRDSPLGFIQNIYEFLDVDSSFEPASAEDKINDSLFKLSGLGQFLHRRIISPLMKTGIGEKIRFSRIIRRWYYRLANTYARKRGIRKPPMDQETKNYLKNFYREDIENLENLIDRHLPHWK